jgi:DNA-binding NarL/FixJ family response regulator
MANRPLRLLIVDDEEVWRDILRDIFGNKPDIALVEAASGQAALAFIQSQDYDLVLLDMRLPAGSEGLDVLHEMKQLKPRTQVIMMSAYADVPRTVEAMNRGALNFIAKDATFNAVVTFRVNDFIATASLIADRERLISSKYDESLRSNDSHAKGKALEDLLAALIASVDGFNEIGRDFNTETEEIDLVFTNASRDMRWRKESSLILVECKNWHRQRVGKNEFVLFKEKIENRVGRCRLGFLVCTERFAETVTKEMLRSSKTEILVVPIDGDGLRELVKSDNRSKCLQNFVDSALLT